MTILKKRINVLIVCCQCVFDYPFCFSEYPADADVYYGHASTIKQLVESVGYDCVVISGSRTQSERRDLSEAKSYYLYLKLNGLLPNCPVFLDEASLDSGENFYIGIMTARCQYQMTPFGFLGFSMAWGFKKRRAELTLNELGILNQSRIHLHSPVERATDPEGAIRGEKKVVSTMLEEKDYLLLGKDFEIKRQMRWQGNEDSYKARFNQLKSSLPESLEPLFQARRLPSKDNVVAFRTYFLENVIH